MRIEPWTPALASRDAELVAAIEARRGGALLELDRMLLWSEPLARGWNVYLRALRQEISLSPFVRELAICVVARLTGADYEFHHHAPELKRPGQPMRNWQRSTIRTQQRQAINSTSYSAT